jgi:tetratricopeptide (TPR) repeat protein
MIDVVFPAMQGQVEGDDNSGYRVTLRPAGSNKITMWVIREEGHYKILDGAEKPNSVGLEILDRLAAGNLAGARILLDWVRDEQHLAGGDDPLAGAAFPRMWTKGKEATAEQMKNAAAAILAQTKPTAREGVKFLEASRREAKSEADKVNLSLALLSGYSNLEESEESYLLASELAKQNPESKRLFFDREIALRGLHRYAEADALAMEMAKRLPDDADMKRALIYTAAARGDYAAAHEVARKLVEEGKAEGQDLNNVAWYALFTGSVEQGDLEAATKSAQMTQNSNAGILHTLGCVYAEMGKTKEAREVLVQAMGLLGMDELDANYWYGFGRIAEQYGESDIAKADYEQAKKPKNVLQVPGSSYALAQKRLSVMGNAK